MWYSSWSFASADRVRTRHFMPRRLAVLLTSPRDLSNSSLFCTLLQKSKAHPLTFQSLPGSLQKHRRCHHERFLLLNSSRLNSSTRFNSFRRNPYSRSPRFSRNQPKLSPRNPFRCNTCRLRPRNPFIRNTYKKPGGRGHPPPRHFL